MRDIKTEFLAASFGYLVNNGLETMSIRNLCKNTGISIGSVYYWFEGKDDLTVSATEYGIDSVVSDFVDFAISKSKNIDDFLDKFMLIMKQYSDKIKFICQVVSSPVYGEKLRHKSSSFRAVYDKYALVFSERMNCPYDDTRAIFYMMASVVLDYSVWGSEESTKLQIEYIRGLVRNLAK